MLRGERGQDKNEAINQNVHVLTTTDYNLCGFCIIFV